VLLQSKILNLCKLCYKYSFHRPSHSADNHHLLTLAMSWERYTCPFPINCPSMWPSQRNRHCFCSDVTSRLVDAFPQLVHYLTSGQANVMWAGSIILCVECPANASQWPAATQLSRCSMELRRSAEPTECPNGQDLRQFRNT